jgi:hypothetical protein
MKTIIAGSRNISEMYYVETAIALSHFEITELICGMAPGVDMLAHSYAKMCKIPIIECPADWVKHGKSAGLIRNNEMATKAEGLIAVWDGKSNGTRDMIYKAKNRKLKVFVFDISQFKFLF